MDLQPADGFGVLLPGEERRIEATFSPLSSVSQDSTVSFRTSLGQSTTVRQVPSMRNARRGPLFVTFDFHGAYHPVYNSNTCGFLHYCIPLTSIRACKDEWIANIRLRLDRLPFDLPVTSIKWEKEVIHEG